MNDRKLDISRILCRREKDRITERAGQVNGRIVEIEAIEIETSSIQAEPKFPKVLN